jgi:anti-sigma-K factor RskA
MSSTFSHTEIQELLGAYAVDAVSTDERVVIEAHLSTCVECQQEIDELRHVTSLLGSTMHETEVPELWSRIQHELNLDGAPPPLRIPRKSNQPAKFVRFAVAGAAAIALIGGAFAMGAAFDDDGNAERPAVEIALAKDAAADPTARIVTLSSSTDGSVSAKVVILPDGRGYVYDSSLPALPHDRTYQLWAVVNNAPVSASVMGESFDAVPFHANGPITAFAITDEVAGGVVNSNRNPIVAGAVTA